MRTLTLLSNRALEEKYELNLPPYPGFAQIVELPQRDGESSQGLQYYGSPQSF